jgi:uncharacterized repeat protein (TIGR01451 family)
MAARKRAAAFAAAAVLGVALLVTAPSERASAQRSAPSSLLKVAAQLQALRPPAAAGDGDSSLGRFEPARAVAGDEVVYTVAFENASDRLVDQIRITAPIPPQLAYVAGTAYCPGGLALFSSDGGRTYGLPDELVAVAADGTKTEVAPDAYTHVRWVLGAPLEQRAKGFARFRAVVR